MIPVVISLLIALAILAVCYIIVKWAIGYFTLPGPLVQIINIIFAVVAIVIVLRALLGFLH